ncbi:MAG: S8/S53 family peptidase [Actinomycetota bacterium]
MAGRHDDEHHERVRRRRNLLLDAGLQFVPVCDDGEETVVRRDVLLVDDEALPIVERLLRRSIGKPEPVCDGLTRLTLTDGRDPVGTARELDELIGAGRVAPEHLMSYGFHALFMSDEPPKRARKQAPLPNPHPDGVRIGLVDSPVDIDHPWLRSVTRLGPKPRAVKDLPEVAHGTFVAGVLRQRLPEARLVAAGAPLFRGARRNTGLVSEVDVARALERLLTYQVDKDPVDIVNISIGGAATHTGMISLDRAVRNAHAARCGRPFAIIASAGNAASRVPFLPAAEPWALGVGALADAEPPVPADFSNRGPWVSASAEGVDIVSSFVNGLEVGGTRFGLFARWSGSSFAAPTVTATVAATALDAGVSAPGAAQLVLTNPAFTSLPDYGVVVTTP